MPNIQQIIGLHEKYKIESNRHLSEDILKSPNYSKKAINEAIVLNNSEYAKYFHNGYPADIALLFIDICDFSTRFKNLSGKQIEELFDKYYDIVIPKIYEFNGEIDKVIGDGIICIFGPPFYSKGIAHCVYQAIQCAKSIIKQTNKTKFKSKIALHAGEVNYFANKTDYYNEYTLIGKPLTELFRLESISENECINYFDQTIVRQVLKRIPSKFIHFENGKLQWPHYGKEIDPPKGTNYAQIFRIKYNG
jgi:class 3 adenylate cyclase